jgi:hypothetical protein
MEAVEFPDQGIDYPIFLPSDSATLNLVGSTSIQIDNILRLTTYNDQVNFAGSLWSKSKQTVNTGFETTFTFQVTRPVNTGGDGFAFVLQNSSATAVGISGCGQGYEGIGNSLVVEFDLYYNDSLCPDTNDPSDNHLGIMYNSSRNHTTPSLVYDIAKTQLDMKDGLVHLVTITYVPATTTHTVKIDNAVTWAVSVNLAQAGIGQEGTMWVGLEAV